MAKASLFKTKEALLEGYCDLSKDYHLDNNLTKGKGGRNVYLLGRVLNSGNISLMRYSCKNGKRVREMLNVILKIETDWNVKRENEEKLRLQVNKCNEINADVERTGVNYQPRIKSKASFVDFIDKVGTDALKETGNRHSVYATMNSLKKHIISYKGEDVLFQDIDEDWVRGFASYVRHDALNINFTRTKNEERRKENKISQNTQHRLLVNLNFVLNKAVKDKYMSSNPMECLDKNEKVKAVDGTREYLTDEEVKMLMGTPFTHGHYNIKEAFLFSCFTGLRFSDLKQLKMSDFRIDRKNGRYLSIKMVKTKDPLKIFIPDVAFNLLPDTEDENSPIFSLPKNDYANQALQKWVKDAGITDKKISFHCGRHSTATLLLSAGIPIAVVSKQLGHLKVATTQIYAQIMDSAQKEASSKIDEMFKR